MLGKRKDSVKSYELFVSKHPDSEGRWRYQIVKHSRRPDRVVAFDWFFSSSTAIMEGRRRLARFRKSVDLIQWWSVDSVQ